MRKGRRECVALSLVTMDIMLLVHTTGEYTALLSYETSFSCDLFFSSLD